MKNFFSKKIVAIFLVLSVFSPVSSNAAAIAGALEPTQWLNNFELLGINIEQAISSAVDTLIEQKEFTLDPIANELAVNTLNQVQNDTIKWIATGFQGGGPAFVTNPEVYFKNVANKEIYKNIQGLDKSQNIFASGIIGNVIRGVRQDRAPIDKQLTNTLGMTIQSSVCTDSNLTSLAEQQIGRGLTTGSQSALSRSQQIENKKRELYLQFCTGNINQNAALQKNLSNCFGSNFNCGGWDAWLALTTNPNNTGYGATARATNLIAQRINAVTTSATNELVNGLMPKKKCVRVANDDEGNPMPEDDCDSWEVEVPAAAIVNQLSVAQGSPFDKAAASDEIGEILARILTTQLTSVFYNAFDGSQRSGINSSNLTDFQIGDDGRITLVQETGTTTISATGTPPIDTSTPNSLKAAIQKTLDELISFETILTRTLALLDTYEQGLSSLETCYDSLPANNPGAASSPDVAEGRSYIADRRGQIQQPYDEASTNKEENTVNITAVRALITSINQDQSLENLNTVGIRFMELVRGDLLGVASKRGQAERKYTKLKSDIDTDTADELSPKQAWCTEANQPRPDSP